MVTTAPAPRGTRRASLESVIFLLDIGGWVVWLCLVGVGILIDPTIAIRAILGVDTDLQHWFAALFMLAGGYGLIVRSAKLGILELPAIWLALTGLTVYLVILAAVIPKGLPWMVGVGICLFCAFSLVRRWAELSILTDEHGRPGAVARLANLLRRGAARPN